MEHDNIKDNIRNEAREKDKLRYENSFIYVKACAEIKYAIYKILIVEDDPAIAALLEGGLKRWGFAAVIPSPSGAAGSFPAVLQRILLMQ